MKKLYSIQILIILIFALGACNNSKSDTISTVDLTERENAILSTTTNNSFVFDFDIDNDFEEVSVWIEKYESGKLVNEKINQITTQVEQSGSIILATSKDDNEKQISFNIGIGSNGGVSSINGFDSNSNNVEKMASVWGNFQGKNILDEGEVVLASICYSDAKNGISSLTDDFYNDVEGHIIELNKYDVVYIFKAEFIK